MQHGEPLHSFCQRIYRTRYSRLELLMERFAAAAPDSTTVAIIQAVCSAVADHVIQLPANVDLGLATLALAFDLRPQT